jgi:hypothetical protein
MSDLTERAKEWLDEHATESGAEIFLIRELRSTLERAEANDLKDLIRYQQLKAKFEPEK